MIDVNFHIETLIKKAAAADKASDAMQFAQAAANAANAAACMDAASAPKRPAFVPEADRRNVS